MSYYTALSVVQKDANDINKLQSIEINETLNERMHSKMSSKVGMYWKQHLSSY